MPDPRVRWRRWTVLSAVLLVAAAVTGWLVRAPTPGAAGPLAAGGAGGEAVPHIHATGDAMAGMVGMTGSVVPVQGTGATAGGYTLRAAATIFTPGVPAEFRFQIVDAGGAPVTRYLVERDRSLHLIVVRDDLTGYQHVHPTMAPDGTWSIGLTLPAPGNYRAYADFTAQDAKGVATAAVLAAPLTASGSPVPQPLAAPVHSVDVDGYTVSYQGRPTVGTTEPLLFTITSAGQPIVPEHYLGAYGHLVVLRQADLGYLHIHPETALDRGAVKFWLAVPGPGSYRAYLDFQADGRVHTAQFTLEVTG